MKRNLKITQLKTRTNNSHPNNVYQSPNTNILMRSTSCHDTIATCPQLFKTLINALLIHLNTEITHLDVKHNW